MIVPIFIHIHEKSDKELKEEMERDTRCARMMEEEEQRKREAERRRKEEIRMAEQERIERLNKEYDESRRKNPWDYQFLPEGWSIFGTGLQIISEW